MRTVLFFIGMEVRRCGNAETTIAEAKMLVMVLLIFIFMDVVDFIRGK